MMMRDWSMSEASRLRHGDAANVSNEARGIFLEQRRCSSSERLFRNLCLYLECFTTGKSPVVVTLTSSNLNVNKDGVIRFVVILWIEDSSKVYEHLWTSTADAPKICVSVRQKNAFYIWHVTNQKSQICDCYTQTHMRCGNAPITASNFEGNYYMCSETNFAWVVCPNIITSANPLTL